MSSRTVKKRGASHPISLVPTLFDTAPRAGRSLRENSRQSFTYPECRRVLAPGCLTLDERELGRLFRSKRLTCARRARINESYVIIVGCGRAVAGVAAYKFADRNICVMHELLLRLKSPRQRDQAVEIVLDALEAACHVSGSYAIVVLRTDIAPTVFKRHGYVVVIERCGGAWFQKHLSPDIGEQTAKRALC